jgi:hypothetical protein
LAVTAVRQSIIPTIRKVLANKISNILSPFKHEVG